MENVPYFKEPVLIEEFKKHSRTKHFAKDAAIIQPGEVIVFVPIVISGSIRVLRQDESGKDIFLYYLSAGETCAVSLNCCSAGKVSQIKAIAEDATDVYLVPANIIAEWLKYKEWREFVNNTYGNRLNELLQVIDLIAFGHMDEQVLHYLRERSKALNTKALFITHQQIADELRTQRESITRLLHTMEQKGIVKLSRNTVELLS